MKWTDEGILLSSKPHGENSAIIEVFTSCHGRHLGLVRGGFSPKKISILQPGSQLDLVWSARLQEHMGIFVVEVAKSRTASLISNKIALSGFNSIASLLVMFLPEREPLKDFYDQTFFLIESMDKGKEWLFLYIYWELFLLREMGIGLDLSRCAVTGKTDFLKYVSPKSGRAVSEKSGELFKNKLLALPSFLISDQNIKVEDLKSLRAGFKLTEYFFDKWVSSAFKNGSLPEARSRFVSNIFG